MKPVFRLPKCRRCGQCCRLGGPALHVRDLPRLRPGLIERVHLVTLRAGETVRDNVAGILGVLDREIVKLAPAGEDPACRFLAAGDDGRAVCSIHRHRPEECRTLSCREPEPLAAMYRRDRLTRAELVDASGALWELITFHESAFPARLAAELARAGDADSLARLSDLAGREASFRRAFRERLGLAAPELDFYFGRSLVRLARAFGVDLGRCREG